MEHLVAMALELREYRKSLVPFLNVPLDSYILTSDVIFDQDSKSLLGIKRRTTFSDISSPEQYDLIQKFLQQKSTGISTNQNQNFYPIYFDLVWKNRYESNGGNLFKTNQVKAKKIKDVTFKNKK